MFRKTYWKIFLAHSKKEIDHFIKFFIALLVNAFIESLALLRAHIRTGLIWSDFQ